MTRPRVKICCISSEAEVGSALRAGADLLGFVSPPLLGLGVIPLPRIAELIASVPVGATPVLLSGLTEPDALSEQIVATRPGAVQLVRATTPATRARLRARFPTLRLIQVVHVLGPQALAEAEAASDADALVLDSAVLDGPDAQLGATGRTHDWALSAQIVAASSLPVFLAGGLSVANVAAARSQVNPHGLDLCSSVRTEGVLDLHKVLAFLEAAR